MNLKVPALLSVAVAGALAARLLIPSADATDPGIPADWIAFTQQLAVAETISVVFLSYMNGGDYYLAQHGFLLDRHLYADRDGPVVIIPGFISGHNDFRGWRQRGDTSEVFSCGPNVEAWSNPMAAAIWDEVKSGFAHSTFRPGDRPNEVFIDLPFPQAAGVTVLALMHDQSTVQAPRLGGVLIEYPSFDGGVPGAFEAAVLDLAFDRVLDPRLFEEMPDMCRWPNDEAFQTWWVRPERSYD